MKKISFITFLMVTFYNSCLAINFPLVGEKFSSYEEYEEYLDNLEISKKEAVSIMLCLGGAICFLKCVWDVGSMVYYSHKVNVIKNKNEQEKEELRKQTDIASDIDEEEGERRRNEAIQKIVMRENQDNYLYMNYSLKRSVNKQNCINAATFAAAFLALSFSGYYLLSRNK